MLIRERIDRRRTLDVADPDVMSAMPSVIWTPLRTVLIARRRRRESTIIDTIGRACYQ